MSTVPLASLQRSCRNPSILARSLFNFLPSRNFPPPWSIYRSTRRLCCSATLPENVSAVAPLPDAPPPPPETELPAGLYVVATPIGCLEDITIRALRVLRTADKVLCEDTRRTSILLNHFGIKTSLESYHLHNERQKLIKVRGI